MKKYLVFVLLLLLFKSGLALEPELTLEIPIADKRASGDILDGKLILSSPEKLSVLGLDGKEVFAMDLKPNQGVVTSEDGEFLGITTYSKRVSPGFLAAQKFELYSAHGKKLWEIENPEASVFYVSNGAESIVAQGEGSPGFRLVFYSRTGKVISSTNVAFPQGVSFSSDGRHVFVKSARDGLLAFNSSGDSTANFGRCGPFATSSDGEYVAAVSGETLKLCRRGEPTVNPLKPNSRVRGMCFSPDNKYLGVIDKKSLHLFEVETGKTLWRYALDQPEPSFISVDVSPGAEKIIAGIDFDKGRKVSPEERHTKGLVLIFDKTGKIMWQKELSYKLWGALFPRVQLSADGNRFSVKTREKIYLFETGQSEK